MKIMMRLVVLGCILNAGVDNLSAAAAAANDGAVRAFVKDLFDEDPKGLLTQSVIQERVMATIGYGGTQEALRDIIADERYKDILIPHPPALDAIRRNVMMLVASGHSDEEIIAYALRSRMILRKVTDATIRGILADARNSGRVGIGVVLACVQSAASDVAQNCGREEDRAQFTSAYERLDAIGRHLAAHHGAGGGSGSSQPS